jgi:hypothetical protein
LTGHRHPADFITCRHCHKPFRAISASHLRRRHGLRRKNTPSELYAAAGRLFGNWESAVKKAGFNYEEDVAFGLRAEGLTP